MAKKHKATPQVNQKETPLASTTLACTQPESSKKVTQVINLDSEEEGNDFQISIPNSQAREPGNQTPEQDDGCDLGAEEVEISSIPSFEITNPLVLQPKKSNSEQENLKQLML